ncbi:MAG: hypothetical protein HYX92_17260 [Chloroflexi bacterium]|nr:hypothetical protein [Chloroflexota bacterium]
MKRAVEIVEELGLAAQNVADYEDTELISSLIAPFGSREDDIFQTAAWVSDLHRGVRGADRDEKYLAYVRAFRGVFSRLSKRGKPMHIATTYHQLEQLNKELDDADLASLSPPTREALQALRHVHDKPEVRAARLRQRYGL